MPTKPKFINLPIFSITTYKTFIYFSGGGGGKTGIPNEILIYERTVTANPVNKISTDNHLYENMVCSLRYGLMVCSANEKMLVYDIKDSGKSLQKLYEVEVDRSFKNATINSICFHYESNVVAVGGDDSIIRFYALSKEKEPQLIWQYSQHREPIRKIDAKCKDLFVSTDSEMAVVVNLKKKEIIRKFYKDQVNPIGSSLQSAFFLNTQSEDLYLIVCHYIPRKQSYVTRQLPNGQYMTLQVSKDQSCASAKQNQLLGIACGQGQTFIVDVNQMKIISKQKGHEMVITSGIMTKGQRFITGTSSCSYVIQERKESSWKWLYSLIITTAVPFIVAFGLSNFGNLGVEQL